VQAVIIVGLVVVVGAVDRRVDVAIRPVAGVVVAVVEAVHVGRSAVAVPVLVLDPAEAVKPIVVFVVGRGLLLVVVEPHVGHQQVGDHQAAGAVVPVFYPIGK